MFEKTSDKSVAGGKRPVIDIGGPSPVSSSNLLSYGLESTLLLDSSGPLALSMMQNLISDIDLKVVPQLSDPELDQ